MNALRDLLTVVQYTDPERIMVKVTATAAEWRDAGAEIRDEIADDYDIEALVEVYDGRAEDVVFHEEIAPKQRVAHVLSIEAVKDAIYEARYNR